MNSREIIIAALERKESERIVDTLGKLIEEY